MADYINLAGRVDWSGENPTISLVDGADGPWISLASFFRVVLSRHGRGHCLVLMQSPNSENPSDDRRNYCFYDNYELARFLVEDFLSHFGTYKGLAGLKNLTFKKLDSVATVGDPRTTYSEIVIAGDSKVELVWKGLGEPYCFVLPPEQSATGKHHLPCLFINCEEAAIVLNGRRLPGVPARRRIAGREINTALLAFSETWILAE